jgi:ParB-like chromosome segregation protein Spo0J
MGQKTREGKESRSRFREGAECEGKGEGEKMTKLPIKIIRHDFQEPDFLFDEKVREIAQAMLRGDSIPPVTVRYDGENYWLQDGFHRIAAALSLDHETIEAEVTAGTLADIEAEFQQMVKAHRGKW